MVARSSDHLTPTRRSPTSAEHLFGGIVLLRQPEEVLVLVLD